MKEFKIYVEGESRQTPSTFKWEGQPAFDPRCYKTINDEFNPNDILEIDIYGFKNHKERDTQYEAFKNSLPKSLQQYVCKTHTVRRLNEQGYADYSEHLICIRVSVRTRHQVISHRDKKRTRLYNEVISFFNGL
jgi:hypothetical protein